MRRSILNSIVCSKKNGITWVHIDSQVYDAIEDTYTNTHHILTLLYLRPVLVEFLFLHAPSRHINRMQAGGWVIILMSLFCNYL